MEILAIHLTNDALGSGGKRLRIVSKSIELNRQLITVEEEAKSEEGRQLRNFVLSDKLNPKTEISMKHVLIISRVITPDAESKVEVMTSGIS
jgi:hypothetical protein